MMEEKPLKPQGICEWCNKALIYEKNPNWESIRHFFKASPAKGYWMPIEHTECEDALKKKAAEEKDSKVRLSEYDSTRRSMRELGFAQLATDAPTTAFNIQPENKKAAEAMNQWLFNSKGILLIGPPGRGKSHLAANLGVRFSTKTMTVAFQPVSSLLALLRRGYDDDTFDERLRMVSSQAHILILDDLGAEKRTDWGEEKIYMILDTRLAVKRPLFVTTNLTESELEERYHPRVVSRLHQLCDWITVGGPDYRRKTERVEAPVPEGRLADARVREQRLPQKPVEPRVVSPLNPMHDWVTEPAPNVHPPKPRLSHKPLKKGFEPDLLLEQELESFNDGRVSSLSPLATSYAAKKRAALSGEIETLELQIADLKQAVVGEANPAKRNELLRIIESFEERKSGLLRL